MAVILKIELELAEYALVQGFFANAIILRGLSR